VGDQALCQEQSIKAVRGKVGKGVTSVLECVAVNPHKQAKWCMLCRISSWWEW
jgi:ABC-type molybdate transport system ATPase subunit